MKSKRIHFDRLDKWTNAILIVLALFCISVGVFDLVPELSPVWTKRMGAVGYVFLVVHLGRTFIRPNYVGWNKRGMNIRIKSILGESFSFKDIKSTDLENGVLSITKLDGKKVELNLSGIEMEDVDRLSQILLEKTVSNGGI